MVTRKKNTLEAKAAKRKSAKKVARRSAPKQGAGLRYVRIGVTKNMGNYESLRFDVEIEVERGETLEAAALRCKQMVQDGVDRLLLEKAQTDLAEKEQERREKAREFCARYGRSPL